MADLIPEKPASETADGVPIEEILEIQEQAIDFLNKREKEKNMLEEDDETS
jgi:hypothetical protein